MGGLILGITQEAANGGGGGGGTPFSLNTDWTGLSSAPSGWVENLGLGAVPVYDVDGVYTSDNTVDGGSFWDCDLGSVNVFTKGTLVVAYNVTSWTEVYNQFTLQNGAETFDLITLYFPESVLDVHEIDVVDGFPNTPASGDTGIVVIAATITTGGTVTLYKYATGFEPIIVTQDISPLTSLLPTNLRLKTTAYNYIDDVSGTADQVKISHTFVDTDFAYIEEDIRGLAAGFGWTGPAFDPVAYVASAVIDQDWTGLGGTPAGWTVDTGTPIYDSTGLQNNGSNLKVTFDASGLALPQLPGWLLNIYTYDDYTTFGFESWAADATEDTMFIGQTEYASGTAIHVESHRVEVGAGVDCYGVGVTGIDFSQPTNPSANKVWAGPLTYVADGFDQYMQMAFFLDDDPDEVSGSYSNDPCTPPGTSGFDPSDLDHLSVRLYDSVSGGTTLIRTLYFTDYDSVANFDNFMAVMAELGWVAP